MTKNTPNKKVPQRMCIACRQMKDKYDLLRIVVKDGQATVDVTSKANGRGYYLCKDAKCIEKIAKHKAFQKQFGFELTEEIIEQIKNNIN
ncbi:MAG: YlxR family protein [Clostridia bacterium]|nr:YlxR family protein [Clostridia bacterium]